MEIEITVFKESGKWYTSAIAKSDTDIPIWKDEFKQFIKNNNPADIKEGFIVTRDIGNGFHSALWMYNDIY